MKRFALFICIGSVILFIINLFMVFYNWSHDLSIWSNVLGSIAMLVIAFATYQSYKKYK